MRRVRSQNAISLIVRDNNDQLTVIIIFCGKPFTPLSRYFATRGETSLSFKTQMARSVCLMLDFAVVAGADYLEPETRGQFFTDFSKLLDTGSIVDGGDARGLWWLPTNSGRHIQNALAFSEWCAIEHSSKDVGVTPDLPYETRIACWRMWSGHSVARMTRKPNRNFKSVTLDFASSQLLPVSRRASQDVASPPVFLEDRFFTLLFRGFKVRGARRTDPFWKKYKVRDMLYTILLHGAGLRNSEPAHIFVDDIALDPTTPEFLQVRIYHPEDGLIPYRDPITGNFIQITRQTYLKLAHNRVPLTRTGKRTGFKPKRYPRFLIAFWFPITWGKIFTQLLRIYLQHCRPKSTLPWLFLTKEGLPLTGKAFAEIHRHAVESAGFQVSKALGTTPHGHRHSYGQRLEQAKRAGHLDTKTVMVCLRQTHPDSQDIYTLPTIARVTEELTKANFDLEPDTQNARNILSEFEIGFAK